MGDMVKMTRQKVELENSTFKPWTDKSKEGVTGAVDPKIGEAVKAALRKGAERVRIGRIVDM